MPQGDNKRLWYPSGDDQRPEFSLIWSFQYNTGPRRVSIFVARYTGQSSLNLYIRDEAYHEDGAPPSFRRKPEPRDVPPRRVSHVRPCDERRAGIPACAGMTRRERGPLPPLLHPAEADHHGRGRTSVSKTRLPWPATPCRMSATPLKIRPPGIETQGPPGKGGGTPAVPAQPPGCGKFLPLPCRPPGNGNLPPRFRPGR